MTVRSTSLEICAQYGFGNALGHQRIFAVWFEYVHGACDLNKHLSLGPVHQQMA